MINRKSHGEILLRIDRVEDVVRAEEHPQEVADNLSTLTLLLEVIILEEVVVDLAVASTLKQEAASTLREEVVAAAIEAVAETHSEASSEEVEETLANRAEISEVIVEVSEVDEEMAMISKGAGVEATMVTFKVAEVVDLAAALTTALATITTQMTITKGEGEAAEMQCALPNCRRPQTLAPSLTCRICNNQARAEAKTPMNNDREEQT